MKAASNPAVSTSSFILGKIESLHSRATLLTGLRKSIGLGHDQDIRPEQWEVLENQLAAVSNRIRRRLKVLTDQHLSEQHHLKRSRFLLHKLGEMELELTNAYSFYDTFMDILTQRLSSDLGPLLRGCDVIAADGLSKAFLPNTTTMPIVYCNRGFGASILREGVRLEGQAPNPIPFIVIPYSRIGEKSNLISIYHEVGHQALVKMNMTELFRAVYRAAVQSANGNALMQSLFSNWSKELLPDFWAFGYTGMAQTSFLRDVLLLPRGMMFQITAGQQHPPAFLRFLMSVEWCRCIWGAGEWDDWADEWTLHYPLEGMDPVTKELIIHARKLLPVVAKATLHTRFNKLGGKPLTSLFDLQSLHPQNLNKIATPKGIASNGFKELPIGVQLATFRLLRNKRRMKLNELDNLMDKWLKNLGQSLNH